MSSKVFVPQGTNQTPFNPQLQHFDDIFCCITSRKGQVVLSKKFNLLKEVIDILSNPKLNAALGLLLTPPPLYEPSIEDLRMQSYKLDSILKDERFSDNQTE